MPKIVDADIAGDFIHALADTDFGGEVDHAIDAPESGGHRFRISNITPDQFDVWWKRLGSTAMHLFSEIVENTDAMPIRQ